MEAVILPIIAILINITLIILFFSKKHVINKETKLYSIMLILNVVFVLIGLLTFAVAKITNNLYFVYKVYQYRYHLHYTKQLLQCLL